MAAAQNETNTAASYVTRFLHRTLSALDVQSRVGSPRPSQENQPTANVEPQYDIFAELGLVSRSSYRRGRLILSDSLAKTGFGPLTDDAGGDDEQYWLVTCLCR